MCFKVNYFVGKSMRQAIIQAPSLEDAEQKANSIFKSWVEIFYADITNVLPAWKER